MAAAFTSVVILLTQTAPEEAPLSTSTGQPGKRQWGFAGQHCSSPRMMVPPRVQVALVALVFF